MQEKPIRRKLAIEIKDAEDGTSLAYLIADCLLPSLRPDFEAWDDPTYVPVEIDKEKMKTAIDAALHAAADQLARMEVSTW